MEPASELAYFYLRTEEIGKEIAKIELAVTHTSNNDYMVFITCALVSPASIW